MVKKAVNEREQELEQCLDKIFEYCNEHKDTCTGCIFWREVSFGKFKSGHCRVMYAPDVFGESHEFGTSASIDEN